MRSRRIFLGGLMYLEKIPRQARNDRLWGCWSCLTDVWCLQWARTAIPTGHREACRAVGDCIGRPGEQSLRHASRATSLCTREAQADGRWPSLRVSDGSFAYGPSGTPVPTRCRVCVLCLRGCPSGGTKPQEWSVVGSGGIRNTPVIFGYFRSFESNRRMV